MALGTGMAWLADSVPLPSGLAPYKAVTAGTQGEPCLCSKFLKGHCTPEGLSVASGHVQTHDNSEMSFCTDKHVRVFE